MSSTAGTFYINYQKLKIQVPVICKLIRAIGCPIYKIKKTWLSSAAGIFCINYQKSNIYVPLILIIKIKKIVGGVIGTTEVPL